MPIKKILYISYDGMTDPLGQSQVLPYLIGLSKLGYQFTILSFEKPARYAAQRHIIEKITGDNGIEWTPLSFTSKPPLLSKLYDAIRMRRKVSSLHRQKKFDMIHCRSYIAADIGEAMKRKHGVKFFFDMRGFWADEKVDGGQWDLKKPVFRRIYKYYKGKERKFLLHADAIVSLTEAAKDELHRQSPYKDLAIDVIPCCADLAHFDYNKINVADQQALQQRLGIAPGKKVISYLGSIGGWYMTAEMFAFVKRLFDQRSDYMMLFLTKDDPERLKKEAAAVGIPADRLVISYAARPDLPLYISLSHASLFFIRPTYSKMASSPTKHAELMGMGIPVICNAIGDTGNIINKTQTGLLVNEFTPEAYDKAISQLPEVEKITPQHIRTAAYHYFDLETGVNHYAQLYARVMGV